MMLIHVFISLLGIDSYNICYGRVAASLFYCPPAGRIANASCRG